MAGSQTVDEQRRVPTRPQPCRELAAAQQHAEHESLPQLITTHSRTAIESGKGKAVDTQYGSVVQGLEAQERLSGAGPYGCESITPCKMCAQS